MDEDVAGADTVIFGDWGPPREKKDRHLISGRVEKTANGVCGAYVDVQHHRLGPAGRVVVAMSHGDSQVLMWNRNWRWHRLVGFPGPAETFDDRWKIRARVAEQVIDAVRSQTGKECFGSGDCIR